MRYLIPSRLPLASRGLSDYRTGDCRGAGTPRPEEEASQVPDSLMGLSFEVIITIYSDLYSGLYSGCAHYTSCIEWPRACEWETSRLHPPCVGLWCSCFLVFCW